MSREKLASLRAKVRTVSENTLRVREEVSERRLEKIKLAPAPFAAAPESLVLLAPLDDRQIPSNSTDVERWFRVGLADLVGAGYIVPKWTVKQRKLAKDLLGIYGRDLVKSAVEYYCSNWNEMVQHSRGRLSGAPTVNLFWSMRERIFAEVQNGKTVIVAPKNRDEFRSDDGSPESGW